MGTVRSPRKLTESLIVLESKEVDLFELLTEVMLTNIDESYSIEELRNLDQDIKATFNYFTNNVVKQVDFPRSNRAYQEAKKLIELMNSKKILYKASIQKVHDRREALFDDNSSSLSLSSHPTNMNL